MALNRNEFRSRYRRLAPLYDPGMGLYRAMGLRINQYRRDAIAVLRLQPGDTVVDLGCGTGLNFAHLQDAVGPQGRIIGVDLTDAMLAQARDRARQNGWRNVELVEADMTTYEVPEAADGVLATLALATIPDYDDVVARVARRLRAGTRLADFELRWPDRWPRWLARFGAWLNRPAGVTPDIVDRMPAHAIQQHFDDVAYREVYFGAAYVCSGRVPATGVSYGQ